MFIVAYYLLIITCIAYVVRYQVMNTNANLHYNYNNNIIHYYFVKFETEPFWKKPAN